VTDRYEGGKFFVRQNAKRYATPLFIVLLVVEFTDVAFATDSIPAILAITKNAFIVYTSNVFAILGLRSLFFALAGLMDVFHRLHYGLSALLIFIGLKMLCSEHYPIPIHIALGVVAGILTASIAASLIFPKKARA
jgi:tellurite resistance protein TerC